MRPSGISTFYVLRHGETNANAAGIIQGSSDISRLTETGKSQAEAVGYMALNPDTTKRIARVFVSPLTRCRETLALLRESAPDGMVPPTETIVTNLREIDFYSWTYRHKNEIKQEYPKEYDAFKRGDPDGLVVDGHFPLYEVWDRADDVWEEIRQHCRTKTTNASDNTNDEEEETANLLVCHGTLGQALIGSAFGLDATTFRQNVFPNCGMAEIRWDNEKDLATSWRWLNLCEE